MQRFFRENPLPKFGILCNDTYNARHRVQQTFLFAADCLKQVADETAANWQVCCTF